MVSFLSRMVVVYRLGGTSLDVTVLAVSGGMYRVVATDNDTSIGGVKFDKLLAQHLAAEFQRCKIWHGFNQLLKKFTRLELVQKIILRFFVHYQNNLRCNIQVHRSLDTVHLLS